MITHVAIRDASGSLLWTLPKPNRHHDLIHKISQENRSFLRDHIQGFTDHRGDFLTRAEAWHEAYRCGQLLPPYDPINPSQRVGAVNTTPGELFSEDLW